MPVPSRPLAVLALFALATACGAPADSGTAAAPTLATAAPLPVATASAPLAAPPPAVQAPVIPGAPAPAPAAPGGVLFKGIPASRQPDGFFVLGRPDAPVPLTDYSDFL